MSQVRKLQTGGTFSYAGDEFDREAFKNQVIKNKDKYLASTQMTPRERELFEQGYEKIMEELNSPDYIKLDGGAWQNTVGVSSNGTRDKNIFGRSKKTENNAVGFATGLLDYTLKHMPKKSENPEYALDFVSDIRDKYFGGKDLDYDIWKMHDEVNPETNVRNHNVRSGLIADLVHEKINELNTEDFDSKYRIGKAYKDKQDLIGRLQLLEDSLRSGEISDKTFTSAASVGFTELAKLLGLEGLPTQKPQDTTTKPEVQDVKDPDKITDEEYRILKMQKALDAAKEFETPVSKLTDNNNIQYDVIGHANGEPGYYYDLGSVDRVNNLILRTNAETGESMWVDRNEMNSNQSYYDNKSNKPETVVKEEEEEPQYKYKDPNSIGRKLENGEGFTTRDYARMAAIGLDLTSVASAYAPGYGTMVSGIAGLGSTLTGLAADLTDKDVSIMEALGVAGAGLAADAVGLIPGLGTASKVAKVAKTIRPLYKPLLKFLRFSGYAAAADTLMRFQASGWDPKALTINDIRVLAGGITGAITRSKANRKAAEADAVHTTQQNARRVTMSDGSTQDIAVRDYNRATKKLSKDKQEQSLQDQGYNNVSLSRRQTNIPIPVAGQNAPRVDKINVDEAVEKYKAIAKGKRNTSDKAIDDFRSRLQAEADRVNATGKKVHDANVQKNNNNTSASAQTPAPSPASKLSMNEMRVLIDKLRTGKALSNKELAAMRANKQQFDKWIGKASVDNRIKTRVRAILSSKFGGVLFAQGGAKNTIVNGFNRDAFLSSDEVTNYLKSLNVNNYNEFNQYEDAFDANLNSLYSNQGGAKNWSNIKTGNRLIRNNDVRTRQGSFNNKGNGLNDLLVKGFKGTGNSGDNKAGGYQDGLMGNQDIQRTFGRGVSQEMAQKFNNVLNKNNLEYYIDSTTGGGRIRPITKTAEQPVNPNTDTQTQDYNHNKAITPQGSPSSKVFLKPEDMIATARMIGSISVNNRNTKDLLKKMRPILVDTYENFVPQQENYMAKASANNQASAIESEGRRIAQETTDASLGAASRLQAVSNARNIRMQGDMASDQRVFETGNIARQESNAAKARRTDVANRNRESMNKMALAKEQLKVNNRLNNWQNVIQPYMAQIEQQYRQNRAQQNIQNNQIANFMAKKQYGIDLENLGKQEALDNYQKALMDNSRIYNNFNFLVGRKPNFASGGKLYVEEKKELQHYKDFASNERQAQKLFYRQLELHKRSTDNIIKHMSSFTASLIKDSMSV